MIQQKIIDFKTKAMTQSLAKIKKAIIGLTTDIIYDTPVLSGRLRNNWIPSINQGANYSMLGVDTSKRKSKVRPVVAETTGKVLDLKLGDTFYFTNNMPYAEKIEFGLYPSPSKTGKTVGGYSVKSPQGMVRKNIIKWSKYFA